ncbi:MAG: alcohol dehydrogenase catalytic domain-containing protein, partial [Planctomycetaceae bacterium]|nr:alcohol dehydrogenase catalytic domain-containing protein [Planctomycetaceae bacterium]
MRAVVFDGTLRFTNSHELAAPTVGGVVVDVIRAGICETDLQLCRGYMGFRGVPGHEFIGIPRS